MRFFDLTCDVKKSGAIGESAVVRAVCKITSRSGTGWGLGTSITAGTSTSSAPSDPSERISLAMAALAAKSAVTLGRDGGGGGGGGASLSKRGPRLAAATLLPLELTEWSWLMCAILCPVIGPLMAKRCSSTGYRVEETLRQGSFQRNSERQQTRFWTASCRRLFLRPAATPSALRTPWAGGSAANCGTEVAEGKLRGGLAATLGTVLNVPPASKEPGAFRIQQHHEGLGQRIDLHPVARLPFGGGRGVMIRTLDQPTEPRMVHVDDPGAVAGLNDDLFHEVSIP